MVEGDWMTTKEAAQYCGVTPWTLLMAARAGTLPCGKTPGKRRGEWRFQKADLDAWLRDSAKGERNVDQTTS